MDKRKKLGMLVYFVALIYTGCNLLVDHDGSGLTKQKSAGIRSFNEDLLELVWSDEFVGTTLDETKWSYETGMGSYGWGNNEKQFYKKENVTVEDGFLLIEAKNQTVGNANYTSGRITTKGKFHFPVGKIAARIKMPKGQAMWPAFWMLGGSIEQNGWPLCGEIDITEMRCGETFVAENGQTIIGDKAVIGTAHWGIEEHHQYGGYYEDITDLSDDFHEYSVLWDGMAIKWYFDDILFQTIDLQPDPDTWGFQADSGGAFSDDKNFYVILNLAVGGNFFTNDANRGFNGTIAADEGKMLIDWVRVYSQNDIVIPDPPPYVTMEKIYSNGTLGDDVDPSIAIWNNIPAITFVSTEDGHSGTKAIKISSDTSEWFGFSFDFSPGNEFDFEDVNALSFWVKSPDGAVIEQAGFGNDGLENLYRVSYKGEDDNGIFVNTDWQRIVIPFPAQNLNTSHKNAFWMSCQEDGIRNKTLYIDDIFLIKDAAISLDLVSIPATYGEIDVTRPTPVATVVTPAKAEYTTDNGTTTLYNMNVAFENWFPATPIYNVTGAAIFENGCIIPTNTGNFSATVSLGGKTSNELHGTISDLLADFEDFTGALNDYASLGWWYAGGIWSGLVPDDKHDGANSLLLMYFKPQSYVYYGSGRNRNVDWDLTGKTNITFWAKASRTGDDYEFMLKDVVCADNIITHSHTMNFSLPAANQWTKVTIPISSLIAMHNQVSSDAFS